MAGKVQNWSELERLYVVESKTHREIARMFDLSNSTVSAKARRDDWEGKRIAYKASLNRRSYELTAESVSHEQHAVKAENVLIARAYIRTFGQQLAEGKIATNAKDTLEFIKFIVSEFDPNKGEGLKSGTTVIEGQAISVNNAGEDVLRRVLEAARARVTAPGGLGADPLVEPPGTRPN
jgi:hypothetical protein